MKNAVFLIACIFLLCLSVVGQMQVVEIEKPQHAKSVAGVVSDPSGAALRGVTVEERSEDWKTVIRSTETDHNGRFHFSRSRNKTMYYIQFSFSGFDWVRIKLQVDKTAASSVAVKMPLGT